MIIVFSGVDCAGKSTQIELLKKEFLGQGIESQSLWSRGGYTPGFELLKKLLRIVIGKKVIPFGRSKKKHKTMSNLFIRYLWLVIAMLDLLFLYAIIIRIKSFLGKVVICDRYLGDTFISFLFILSVEKSIYRSTLKYEPFPDSKEILQQRLDMYKSSTLFDADNWIKINGVDSIVSSANIIKKKIFSILKITNAA